MKYGTVAMIGRPNVGKSTLVNTIIGHKVAITSPKPQTTRFPIQALFTSEEGQIIFVDTPGIFDKTKDLLSKKINKQTLSSLGQDIDVVMYIVDPTRKRDFEESKVLGIVRKIKLPKVLVFNKTDIKNPPYLPQYEFLKDEFDHVFYVSALERKHTKPLIDKLFDLLPEKDEKNLEQYDQPILNIDSKTFLAELVREKIFLRMRKELPYTTTVIVDTIAERKNGVLYIKARILTTDNTYKKMLIGQGGWKIKEMGSMARRELEIATNKKVYLELEVEIDKHWVETLS